MLLAAATPMVLYLVLLALVVRGQGDATASVNPTKTTATSVNSSATAGANDNHTSDGNSSVAANLLTLPDGFLYGCATSAYQIEGGVKEGGRGVSNWDFYAHNTTGVNTTQAPGASPSSLHVQDGDTGDNSVDFYHTYKEDIPLFATSYGINVFSFSIAWTRILPTGKESSVNQQGVDYYLGVIKSTHTAGMKAACTLFHWDFPQSLQDQYGGWLSDQIVEDFAHYAELTMRALGTACDLWISVNEPRTFCANSYGQTWNIGAPGKAVTVIQTHQCVHRQILAHARSHKIWKQLKQQGVVQGHFGIKIDGAVLKPSNVNDAASTSVVGKAMDMGQMGWIAAPLTTGDYAPVHRKIMGDQLPRFSTEESAMVKDSYDILFWDAYSSAYVKSIVSPTRPCNDTSDGAWPTCVAISQYDFEGKLLGKPTGSMWNFLVNDTLIAGLEYLHNRWGPKALAIGENGLSLPHGGEATVSEAVHDDLRIEWYKAAVSQIDHILKEGKIPLVGYLFWSCIRNFEWASGYREDFGLIYTPITDTGNNTRSVKESASYLRASFSEVRKQEPSSDATSLVIGGGARTMKSMLFVGTMAALLAGLMAS